MFSSPNRLVAVGGPSSVGKKSLINRLIQKFPHVYQRPRSFTSRPRRSGEDLDEYTFLTRLEIERLHKNGELLNFDEAYGHAYGISKIHLNELCQTGLIPVKEIHPANQPLLRQSVAE